MNLSLSVGTNTNLSLWNTKPDHCVKSICVQSLFLVRIFSRIWTEYRDLQSKSPYSLRIWRNMSHMNPFHAVDVGTLLLCYFDDSIILQIYSYKLAEWLPYTTVPFVVSNILVNQKLSSMFDWITTLTT